MDYKQFKNILKVYGLRYDEASCIVTVPGQSVNRTCFAMYGRTIHTTTGEEFPLNHVASMTFDIGSNTTFFKLYSGMSTSSPPGAFSAEDTSMFMRRNVVYPMPKMDSELNDLFPVLYPNLDQTAYYDEMSEAEMIDESMFDPEAPRGSFVRMTDKMEYKFYDNIERKLKDLGCDGTMPPVAMRHRCIMVNINKTRKNAFKDWVLAHPWDGKHRVDTWFQDVFNANAKPLRRFGLEDLYLANLARAWVVGAIKRIFTECQHDIVPVLIGPQGKCKKTSGLRYTAGNSKWFQDTTINISSKDGIAKFLDAARGRIIIELAESRSIRSADQEDLKAFISKTSDQFRKPYQTTEEVWPRHFILAASSNINDVFTDLTGNRRYYPVMCSPQEEMKYRTKENVEQMWAEAYQLYLEGQPTFLDADWLPAVIMQKYSAVDNANVEAIDNWLNDPNNGFTAINCTISKRYYMKLAHGISYTEPIPESLEKMFRAWALGTEYWDKDPDIPKYVDGLSCRSVYVRTKQGTQPLVHIYSNDTAADVINRTYTGTEREMMLEAQRLIEEEEKFQKKRAKAKPLDKAIAILNTLCNESFKFSEGDIIDVCGVPGESLKLLQDNNYLYYDGMCYRLARRMT